MCRRLKHEQLDYRHNRRWRPQSFGTLKCHVQGGEVSGMINGVLKIKPLVSDSMTTRDVVLAMMCDLGARCSSFPDSDYTGTQYTTGWEFFEPRAVKDPEELPEHWRKVYDLHNRPNMRDCRTMRYRYISSPIEIVCQHPRLPRKGIFCLSYKSVRLCDVQAKHLIWIDDEVQA